MQFHTPSHSIPPLDSLLFSSLNCLLVCLGLFLCDSLQTSQVPRDSCRWWLGWQLQPLSATSRVVRDGQGANESSCPIAESPKRCRKRPFRLLLRLSGDLPKSGGRRLRLKGRHSQDFLRHFGLEGPKIPPLGSFETVSGHILT